MNETISNFFASLYSSDSSPDLPFLQDLDVASIANFLSTYDAYGLLGGKKTVKECIDNGTLQYICIFEIKKSLDIVGDEHLLRFLNTAAKTKPIQTLDAIIGKLENVSINYEKSNKIQSLFIAFEGALYDIGLTEIPNDNELCLPVFRQIELLMKKLQYELRSKMEKRLIFMAEPVSKVAFREALVEEAEDFNWTGDVQKKMTPYMHPRHGIQVKKDVSKANAISTVAVMNTINGNPFPHQV